MTTTQMRCFGSYQDDRMCDLCALMNSSIAHACKRRTQKEELELFGEIKTF